MNGKVAAVLGVGPGLGAAVARRFAGEGFAVALLARREESVADAWREIEDAGGEALFVSTDATDPASVAAAFERVENELGAPEVFVYNAGAFQMGSILEVSPEKFDECFKANCAGAFYAAAAGASRDARSRARYDPAYGSDGGDAGRSAVLGARGGQVRVAGAGAVDGTGVWAAGYPCRTRRRGRPDRHTPRALPGSRGPYYARTRRHRRNLLATTLARPLRLDAGVGPSSGSREFLAMQALHAASGA